MRIEHTILEGELPTLVRWLINAIGWDRVEKRVREVETSIKDNPFLEDLLRRRHEFEIVSHELFVRLRRGQSITRQHMVKHHRLFGFAAACQRVCSQLPAQTESRFLNGFKKALDQEFGFIPLAFEMSAAVHLSQLGWDVEFADLMQGGGPDLIARKDKKVVEVECKSVSVDSGRKIHQKQFIQLLKTLWPIVEIAISKSGGTRVIQVELSDRLTSSNSFHTEIRDAVNRVLNGGILIHRSNEFSVSVSGEINAPRQSSAHEAWLRRKNSQTIVSVASKKPDKVLGTLLYRLKEDSKRQFTQERPALMLVQLQDLTNDQMIELKEAENPQGTGLQQLATHLFDRRPHLLGLSFLNALHILSKTLGGVHSSQGLTYTFFNSKRPLQETQIAENELFIY